MSGHRRISLGVAAGVLAAFTTSTGIALGTGPYTLPFHDYTTSILRGYSAGHRGIDYNLNYEPVVAARQGVVVEMAQHYADSGSCAQVEGNYVLLRHADGQHSLYLHLKQNSITVGLTQAVSAGQLLGTSGNSGNSCGPHLHYALTISNSWRLDSQTLDPNGDWTTADPGRVPFLAAYVREHSPSGYSALVGSVWTTWVEVRNDGGRTWSVSNDTYGKGRVFLDATNSAGTKSRVSPVYVAGDWETNSRPGRVDDSTVVPGETARITFKLRAPYAGSFIEYFNLAALGVTYFNYSYFQGFYIPITVRNCC